VGTKLFHVAGQTDNMMKLMEAFANTPRKSEVFPNRPEGENRYSTASSLSLALDWGGWLV